MSKPPNNRQHAFQSSADPKPESSGSHDVSKMKSRYVKSHDATLYADTEKELDEMEKRIISRSRFAPVPLQASKKV